VTVPEMLPVVAADAAEIAHPNISVKTTNFIAASLCVHICFSIIAKPPTRKNPDFSFQFEIEKTVRFFAHNCQYLFYKSRLWATVCDLTHSWNAQTNYLSVSPFAICCT
jgi:hypothetical protein